MRITVRHEQSADVQTIRNITVQAFSESELGYHGEADLVDRLRESCPSSLSLVAERDKLLMGHVLFTPVTIIDDSRMMEGMGLAPLSVLPKCQRHGIGSQLVRAGLDLLHGQGCRFVIVLGDPEFYVRFGFEPAERLGIGCEFDGIPAELFQIKPMNAMDSEIPKGIARYRPEFSTFS